MKKILIATHAHYASGIKSTIELLTGPKPNIEVLDCFVDGTNVQQEIEKFVQGITEEDQAYIFTDIKFGSVNQTVTNLLSPFTDRCIVITGFNLPVVLELCLTDDYYSLKEVEEIVERAKQELIIMNNYHDDALNEDDFFN